MSVLTDITQTLTDLLAPVNVFVNDIISKYIWYVAFVMLIGAALFFLWKFRGVQFVTVKDQLKSLNPFRKAEIDTAGDKHSISSFQAFCVGLGARVGIGNITGVTSAIIMGGAGALFWMWIFAILGAGTAFVECTLGQIFKERKSDGHYFGGPAYYIYKGLKNKKFALFTAFWIILAFGIGSNANQAANASAAFANLELFSGIESMPVFMGIIIAGLTAVLVFGGIKRIAKTSEIIVPVMVILWLIMGIIVIIIGFNQIGQALKWIFTDAFDFSKIVAGFAGSCVMWGLKRGIYSNTAGLGSTPNISSSANVKHPVKQGIVQTVSVYMDTLVVCSITAFMILTCLPSTYRGGWECIWGNPEANSGWAMGTVQATLTNALGGDWILYVLAAFIFIFAFSTIIANYSSAEANVRFMRDKPSTINAFRIILVIIVFLACIIPIDLVWNLCDVFMAITAVSNIIALFLLWKYARIAWDDWKRQKADGIEEPVFDADNIDKKGLDFSGVTEWHHKT